jgi:hypothetical protein
MKRKEKCMNNYCTCPSIYPLVIKHSFEDGRYSPSTRMKEIEWQIMLEQFVVSGVVVKDEIKDIDSD